MWIEKNVFNGSLNIGWKRDYVIYFKGFNYMVVVSNYVRGWFVNGMGGIKVWNG